MADLTAPGRGVHVSVGIFKSQVNTVDNSSLLESWKGVLPEIQKLRMATPCILTLEHHLLILCQNLIILIMDGRIATTREY